MSIRIYKKAAQALGAGDLDWDTNTIKLVLVDYASYTVNISTDEFLSDIPAPARISTSAALTTKTNVLGVLDADDSQFTAVGAGAACEAIVMYVDTGVAATSRLMYVFDNSSPAVSGLPVTPDGGNIAVTWDNGAHKIVNLDG